MLASLAIITECWLFDTTGVLGTLSRTIVHDKKPQGVPSQVRVLSSADCDVNHDHVPNGHASRRRRPARPLPFSTAPSLLCSLQVLVLLPDMANVLRVPKLDLPAVLAQQNPQIDLRLEAYEVSTRNFIKAVSNYTQRAVTEITNRKNNFNAEKKRFAEKTQQVETETNQCKLKEIELIAGVSTRSCIACL